MSSLAERAQQPLNLQFYQEPNQPERVGELTISAPSERQYVLRCPIKIPGRALSVPDELSWCTEFIETATEYQQRNIGVEHPYTYLTVRHGQVTSETDDAWHVDGFSMKAPHPPEQNYVWVDHQPTEVTAFPLYIPGDFDPLRHNLHYLIQDSMPSDAAIQTLEESVIYAMDPYIFHRRPRIAAAVSRTFLRLSMTPIPIDDVKNCVNPTFGDITSDYDGVVDFRDTLARYPIAS